MRDLYLLEFIISFVISMMWKLFFQTFFSRKVTVMKTYGLTLRTLPRSLRLEGGGLQNKEESSGVKGEEDNQL